jgi:hypothetical protein
VKCGAADAASDSGNDYTCDLDAGKLCVNGGAACARVCKDGSNPCSEDCIANQCVAHGCPEDVAAAGCKPSCGVGETCVMRQLNGGAQRLPDDAGNCPAGTHPSNLGGSFVVCANDPTFMCAKRPSSCGPFIDCNCATDLCGSYMCTGASNAEVDCVLNAP